MNRKAFSAAFPATTPVMLGYLTLGTAFGLLMNTAGYNVLWSLFMSVTVFAGSAQILGVELLATMAGLGKVALMTFILNFRHIVYGLSMLEKYQGAGRRKPYLIFSLTDETYALLTQPHLPKGVEPHDYYFAVSLLNQCYWVAGSVIGALAGAVLPINTQGADFAMTALFVVIVLDQWESAKSHLPALLGFGLATALLLLLGPDNFLIPTLVAIIGCLLLCQGRLEQPGKRVKA